jgi:DNA-binding XRE family transcriptional regulator
MIPNLPRTGPTGAASPELREQTVKNIVKLLPMYGTKKRLAEAIGVGPNTLSCYIKRTLNPSFPVCLAIMEMMEGSE